MRIITERYELVNIPGAYNLVMEELAAPSDPPRGPTAEVAVTQIPDDIELNVYGYYPPHDFTKVKGKPNTWVLDNVLLPGQEVTVLFKHRKK